jgi:hypothetical protein
MALLGMMANEGTRGFSTDRGVQQQSVDRDAGSQYRGMARKTLAEPAANSFQQSLLVADLLMQLSAPGRHGARAVPYSGAIMTLIFVRGGRARTGRRTSPQLVHGLPPARRTLWPVAGREKFPKRLTETRVLIRDQPNWTNWLRSCRPFCIRFLHARRVPPQL